MNISGFIFDMDGVIFDTEMLWKDAFLDANSYYGLDLDETYRQSTCGKSEQSIRMELNYMFPNLDVDAYRDKMLYYVNEKIEKGEFDIKYGFFDLINYLKKKGIKIALATSSKEARAKKLFEKKGLKIKDFFDSMVFCEEVDGRSKPDPLIFKLAANKIDVPEHACCVVEDSINGLKAAVNGGFIPIMAIDLIKPDDYCKSHVRIICNNLKEIIGLLDESN